ncbi:kinesin-like protein KIN-12F [Phalaenopsis equestris]|uniref:kinesin-like protein KIN-12F n=1 Tax=Phalaenopsis equestris TaxID=78828 RepID=UPI0009E1C6C4|nr:kinesin-like protein KIN-12F [Phalaenopsis equestris]
MANHALNFGNGYSAATPRSIATGGRASSVHSGTSSMQSTPTKSVSKPMINGVSNSRAPQCGGTAKTMNFSVSSKKIPLSSAPPPVYASVEVPHFELKEDPSFWMDHNVQDLCLTSPEKVPCSCSTKHAEEVLYLEQELDRLKSIIAVEKSSRVEAEERAILSETELSITNDKLLLISKRYDATIDKLKDTRSVIEALES